MSALAWAASGPGPFLLLFPVAPSFALLVPSSAAGALVQWTVWVGLDTAA